MSRHLSLPIFTAIALALSACAHAAVPVPSPDPVKEAPAVNKDDSSVITPKITVEQALARLLELIRTSKTMHDFTPERLGQVMQVPIEWAPDGNAFGQGGLITPQWNLGLGVSLDRGPSFDLSLNPNPPGTSPPMTGLCQMDFDRFSAELESMGFSRSHNYDSLPPPLPGAEPIRHPYARLLNDYFDRPGMRISVYPRGESKENPGHPCVEMVRIDGL